MFRNNSNKRPKSCQKNNLHNRLNKFEIKPPNKKPVIRCNSSKKKSLSKNNNIFWNEKNNNYNSIQKNDINKIFKIININKEKFFNNNINRIIFKVKDEKNNPEILPKIKKKLTLIILINLKIIKICKKKAI